MTQVAWKVLRSDELTVPVLYEALRLRTDVFVVEQKCAYPELDDVDLAPGTYHIIGQEVESEESKGTENTNAKIIAYARVFKAEWPHIGRIVVAQSARKGGLGVQLVTKAKEVCLEKWPHEKIEMGAQAHLMGFYGKLGFKPPPGSEVRVYPDYDIPHVDLFYEP